MKKLAALFSVSIGVFCLTGCSSEPSSSEKDVEQHQAKVQEEATPKNQSLTIAAFLRGEAPDEAAAKAFERGMDLAAEKKSPPTVIRKVFDRAAGAPNSPSFKQSTSDVPLVVYWQTADLLPAASVLKESETIVVPVWNVTKKVASLGQKVFGFGYGTEKSFANFAKFAGNKLKSYRFAILSSSAEPFSSQSQAFIEETKSQGNTVVFEEKVENTSADFKALLTRATKETCDTVFAVLPSDALIKFIKAAREASFKGKILVGDSFYTTELEALGKDAEGIHLVQAWSDDAQFKTQYSTKHGGEPDGVTLGAAALGYDLIQCIESAGTNPKAGDISYSWLSNPCVGLTGKTQFSGERIAQRVKRILTIKDGKFELAEK